MKRWVGLTWIAFWGCCIPCGELQAEDSKTQGSVYEIKEIDPLMLIERRLMQMSTNGELQHQQEIFKSQALSSLGRPTPVKGLKPTRISRTIERDLTVTLAVDLKNTDGEVIQKAGTKINPLESLFTKKWLIFLDGDNESQLQWALKQYKDQYGLVKLVLVNGSPLNLMQQYEVPFYFDQAGHLSQYFKLEQIPAKVYQEKDKLIIAEVKM